MAKEFVTLIRTGRVGIKPSRGRYLARSGNEWTYDSKTELAAMMLFDSLNLDWIKNTRSGLKIPYIDSKGKNRNYIPDFIIAKEREKDVIVEIKGGYSSELEYKFQAAEEFCKKSKKYRFVVMSWEMILKTLVDEEIVTKYHKTEGLKRLEKYKSKKKR